MSSPSALTLYKKQEGTLAVSKDKKSVSWTPSQPAGASPALVVDVVRITNLQQTPADKPKVMLKVFVTEPGQKEPGTHVFQFASKTDARGEANAIRDTLSSAMAKASQAATATSNGAGPSAAMAIAAAISGGKGASWEDDETLVSDFTKQFWASRVHLLRAHALAQSQSKGLYNVFSEIKRTDEGGRQQLNLTSEHIKAIFEQYPIMRIVYDEIVPKKIKDDREFWSRFFQSQLYSVLRGLKVDRRLEAKDAIFDLYLDHPELTGQRPTSSELHIPKFIDLEGNEENHSQRQGNRPDMENQQKVLEKGPIIRRLNLISEKLMAAVKPSDADMSAPIGIDESEYEQLRLRDLALTEQQQHIKLNIQKQSQLYADTNSAAEDIDAARIRALNPTKAIQKVCRDLDQHYSASGAAPTTDMDLDEADEDIDDADLADKPHVVGSLLASEHIHSLIEAHRAQSTEADTIGTNPKSYGGLSESVYERLVLTHATSLEFLHQFWSAFHSGDPARVGEVASLVESLDRARERIEAIARDAQGERDAKIKSLEAQTAEIFRVTGKRKKVDKNAVGGGEAVVKQLLGPSLRSLQVAVDTYKRTYEEQISELQRIED
ncbi:RNA polymerase II transcription factor B subunit 1 [Lithohypha guttulata]|uniref:RNA polymerase II transcription factor B subunit 1 n=1 Tax=Lithohypha guttulata TaxID=1690604 RepID=A0AAN7Y6R9_9EURO|nr:RNA polymerase II transcription factor B subunit 1 [Lithohypha guttulata]